MKQTCQNTLLSRPTFISVYHRNNFVSTVYVTHKHYYCKKKWSNNRLQKFLSEGPWKASRLFWIEHTLLQTDNLMLISVNKRPCRTMQFFSKIWPNFIKINKRVLKDPLWSKDLFWFHTTFNIKFSRKKKLANQ